MLSFAELRADNGLYCSARAKHLTESFSLVSLRARSCFVYRARGICNASMPYALSVSPSMQIRLVIHQMIALNILLLNAL